jgi:hypothetical protein
MQQKPRAASARASDVDPAGRPRNPTDKAAIAQPPTPSRQARWQAANPKARWAHGCLQSALRRGLVERQPCAVCGDEKVDGHHPDYDRPMCVIWLCRKHHKATHRDERNS